MPEKGFHIADAFVEIHADKDPLKRDLRDLNRDIDATGIGDRIGRDVGEGISRTTQKKSEDGGKKAGGKFANTFSRQVKAALDSLPDPEVHIEDAAARSEIEAIRRELTSLGDAKVGIDLDSREASLRLEALAERLNALDREDAQIDVRVDTNAARGEIEKFLGREVPRIAESSGGDGGGKLAQGFRQGFIRNSPLIVAAVGGALAAGAPVALAGATALFAGVGVAAAAQSQKVQTAWVGLWHTIVSETRSDASVLEDVTARAAGRIGQSFEHLRPQIREAFAASSPLIDSFVDDLTGAAENAVPGFVNAVKSSGPVVTGLGELLRDVGSGVGDFFSILSEHAPEAGVAFQAIGDIIRDLLPILGELLGRGADLASIVLPPLASVLHVVAGALDLIGPLLPPIIAGFTALKVVKSLSDSFTGFAEKGLGGILGKIPGVNSGLGKVGEAVKGLGSALPVVGIVAALVVQEFEAIDQKGRELADGLRKGGAAAREAKQELQDLGQVGGGAAQQLADSSLPDWFVKLGAAAGGASGVVYDAAGKIRETHEQSEQAWRSMDRLSQANSKVAEWTATLTDRLGDENATSAEVEAAKRRLKYWSDQQAQAEADLELSIHGVTQAMIEQTDQALASIDSNFAYQHAVNQLEDAQAAYNEELGKSGPNSEATSRALLDLEEQTYRTAQAFGQQQADLSGASKDSEEYARILQEQTLVRLKELAATASGPVRDALLDQIAKLEASGVAANNNAATVVALTGRLQDLGLAVTEVPGEKFVRVDAPTEEQKQRLRDLGYTVTTLPDGDIYVSASTADADAAINRAARDRTATIYTSVVQTGSYVARPGVNVRQAQGGLVHAFADGGFEPMKGGIAKIVPPNTQRIIGDRIRNDEAYVPIDPYDGRAQQILTETNRRMGRDEDGSRGRGGISIANLTVKIDGTFDLSSARDLKRMAAMIRQAIIDLEREAS